MGQIPTGLVPALGLPPEGLQTSERYNHEKKRGRIHDSSRCSKAFPAQRIKVGFRGRGSGGGVWKRKSDRGSETKTWDDRIIEKRRKQERKRP